MKRTLLALLVASPLLAADVPEFHYRTEMSGASLPQAMKSETWIKGDKVRMEMETPVGPSTTIVKDKVVYSKMGAMAMKIPADLQKSAGPNPSDYAQRMEEYLKRGTKVGTEVVDGEKCDKYHLTRDQSGRKVEETVWISPSLQFPRKIVMKTKDQGEITMRNYDIVKKVTLANDKFEPEPGVNYMDMTEMMKSMQKQQQAQ